MFNWVIESTRLLLQNQRIDPVTLQGLRIDPLPKPICRRSAKYPLVLSSFHIELNICVWVLWWYSLVSLPELSSIKNKKRKLIRCDEEPMCEWQLMVIVIESILENKVELTKKIHWKFEGAKKSKHEI